MTQMRFSYLNGQKQAPEVSCKKTCSNKFSKLHGKSPVRSLIFNKVAGLRPTFLLEKSPLAQVFSYEFCVISMNTFFIERLWTTVSKPNIVGTLVNTLKKSVPNLYHIKIENLINVNLVLMSYEAVNI